MEDKSNIYLDLEDDITAIISKVGKAKEKTVNLVVPKRSSTLESVVNLKLVKKSAASADKTLVLITDESKITTMAGRLGILTSPNLKVPPAVPEVLAAATSVPSNVIEDTAAPDDAAGPAAPPAPPAKPPASAAAPAAVAAAKSKKSKIPDFNRFKKRLLIGALVGLGLIALLWATLFVLPKAVVSVQGKTEAVDTEFGFTLDTEAERPNLDQAVLPGKNREITKTLSGTFKATGKKDVGTKATGTISAKNCEDTNPRSLSAGTSFTASNGKTFRSNAGATVPAGSFSGGGTVCNSSAVDIAVSAAENGDSYNLGATSYTSPALSGNFIITGSQMTGGTSKTVGVVTQGDVDAAKNEAIEKDKATTQKELADRFDKDDYVIKESFSQNVTEVASDPPVNGEGDSGRVTVKVSYLQYGVKQQDLKDLLKHQLERQVKEKRSDLAVVDEGLDKAKFTPLDKVSPAVQKFRLATQGLLGPDLKTEQLQEELAGKKRGEAEQKIKAFPNVTGVNIQLSPFWVRKLPRNPDKITIKLDVPKDQR